MSSHSFFSPPSLGNIRRRKVLSQRRRDGLIQYSFNKTSQSGEDGIIQKLFELIPYNENTIRWCVDVGAWDGKHLSNTHSLLSSKKQKWNGVLIEGDISKYQELVSLDRHNTICIQKMVSCYSRSSHSLVTILSSLPPIVNNEIHYLPCDFDFLSIDVDGTDYWILYDLLLQQQQQQQQQDDDYEQRKFHPKVICIEFNPTIPHDVIYIPPQDDTIRHGCSITAIVELASSSNYQLVESTCYNVFLVRTDIFHQYIRPIVPFYPITVEQIHEVTMGTNIYQLYNGTLKLNGCTKLLWHDNKPIVEENIQVLQNPKECVFPFAPTATMEATNGIKEEMDNNQDNETKVLQSIAVDMSSYCSHGSTNNDEAPNNDEDRRRKQSKQLLQSLQKDGFALIKGVMKNKSTICTKALHWTNLFLQEAPEGVRRSCLSKKDRARRGYSPQNSENFASLIGEKRPNDLVRKYRVGPITTYNSESVCETKQQQQQQQYDSLNNNNDKAREESTNNQEGRQEEETNKATFTKNTTQEEQEQQKLVTTTSALLQPNIWPSSSIRKNNELIWNKEDAIEFQSSIETYYQEMCLVAQGIVSAICDGIDEEAQAAKQLISTLHNKSSSLSKMLKNSISHTSILTLLGYRKGARHQGKHARPLVAAHTDVGVITILLFDGGGDCAMLQRMAKKQDLAITTNNNVQSSLLCNTTTISINSNKEEHWINVKLPHVVPINDPIFVVNIGDCLSDLCGGILPSTLHRVMPWKGGNVPRNCLAFFVGLDPENMLEFPCITGGESSGSMTYEEWRRQRIKRATSVLR